MNNHEEFTTLHKLKLTLLKEELSFVKILEYTIKNSAYVVETWLDYYHTWDLIYEIDPFFLNPKEFPNPFQMAATGLGNFAIPGDLIEELGYTVVPIEDWKVGDEEVD